HRGPHRRNAARAARRARRVPRVGIPRAHREEGRDARAGREVSGESITLLAIAAHALVVLAAAVYISARRMPSAAIAWILAIAFVPLLGIAWFLLVGAGRLPRRRRDQQRDVNRAVLERAPGEWEVGHGEEWPEALASAARLNRELGALPI